MSDVPSSMQRGAVSALRSLGGLIRDGYAVRTCAIPSKRIRVRYTVTVQGSILWARERQSGHGVPLLAPIGSGRRSWSMLIPGARSQREMAGH